MNINWIVIALNLLLSLLLAWLAALYSRSTLMSVYSVSTTQRSKNQTTMNGSVKKATQTHTHGQSVRERLQTTLQTTPGHKEIRITHIAATSTACGVWLRACIYEMFMFLSICVCVSVYAYVSLPRFERTIAAPQTMHNAKSRIKICNVSTVTRCCTSAQWLASFVCDGCNLHTVIAHSHMHCHSIGIRRADMAEPYVDAFRV